MKNGVIVTPLKRVKFGSYLTLSAIFTERENYKSYLSQSNINESRKL